MVRFRVSIRVRCRVRIRDRVRIRVRPLPGEPALVLHILGNLTGHRHLIMMLSNVLEVYKAMLN